MKQFIGTKIINAKLMDRLAYNVFRGWKLPDDENGTDEGYLVEYLDGGEPNTKEYAGYVSWSPKEQFENAYKESGNLSFGDAIVYMKQGYKVARKGWNGKGMYCIYVTGSEVKLHPGTPYHNALTDNGNMAMSENETTLILPHIDMWTIDSTGRRAFLPGWLASQSDMLSDDWCIVS